MYSMFEKISLFPHYWASFGVIFPSIKLHTVLIIAGFKMPIKIKICNIYLKENINHMIWMTSR